MTSRPQKHDIAPAQIDEIDGEEELALVCVILTKRGNGIAFNERSGILTNPRKLQWPTFVIRVRPGSNIDAIKALRRGLARILNGVVRRAIPVAAAP